MNLSNHAALAKMLDAGAHPSELAALRRRLAQLDDPLAGRLHGDTLTPVETCLALSSCRNPRRRKPGSCSTGWSW